MSLNNVELNAHLQARYKELFTRVVAPVLTIAGIFLIVSYWDTEDKKVMSGMLAIILVIAFNLPLSLIQQIKTPWGIIHTRSDVIDTLRWCINFPLFDIYIVWALGMHELLMVTLWLLLTFGAMSDVFQQKYKLMVVGVAITCFCIVVFWLYPLGLNTQSYFIFCYVGLVFVFWKLQRFVLVEMQEVFREQQQRQDVEREAADLQRDAAIGRSTRMVNHELNTLIGVALLSSEWIGKRHETDDTNRDKERLQRSLEYMSRVSTLILDDLGNANAPVRQLSLAELQQDLRLLLSNDEGQRHARLEFDFPADADRYRYEERTGSTYLIIHNLVKNADESVQEKFGDQPGGKIRLGVKAANKEIIIAIEDNGVGMTSAQVNDMRQQTASTTKLTGHGLGLQFVQRECKSNGFALAIESEPGVGSRFVISGLEIIDN